MVPGDEERFVQAVDDVDDEVVVRHGVNVRARELSVDEYSLQRTESLDRENSVIETRSACPSLFLSGCESESESTVWGTPRG